MNLKIVSMTTPDLWDKYVLHHQNSGYCHLFNWKKVIMDAYNHDSIYLAATAKIRQNATDNECERILGILPLYRLKSLSGRSRFVSNPFFDTAGILAHNSDIERALFQKSILISSQQNAVALELRQNGQLTAVDCNIKDARSEIYSAKVGLHIKLAGVQQKMMAGFGSKLRNQILKGQKNGLVWKIGKQDLLEPFYEVFSRNMRDLGSPVHSKRFFKAIFTHFYHHSFICVVYYRSEPVAASFMFVFKKKLSNPWASSIKEFRHLQTNMFLYWQMIRFACNIGMEQFDMGRSSKGASTYRFKKQWSPTENQIFWYRWLFPADSRRLQTVETLSIDHWNKIPLKIANILGPIVRRSISL